MSIVADYRRWITEAALPLWADAGFDRVRGRFVERLGPDGRPVEGPQRSMVQARQIFVYAHAAHCGWCPEGARLADAAMASLRRDFETTAGEQSSFAFSIGADGRVVSAARDTYGHAFILFALAWLHRVTGEAKLLALADRTTAYCEARLADPLHGGFLSQHPLLDPEKRQNPHMHLLEAFLALEAAAPGRGYLQRADRIVALFADRMVDRERGVVLEYFESDWSPHTDPCRRDVAEPGHLFEWVWLLRQHARAGGRDHGDLGRTLDRIGRDVGLARGLVVDQIDRNGAVLVGNHRIWPHTEAIKAATVSHEDGDSAARPFAEGLVGRLFDTFLDRPFAGGWIDHIDADHRPLVDYVPASTLYHLALAATEMARVFDNP